MKFKDKKTIVKLLEMTGIVEEIDVRKGEVNIDLKKFGEWLDTKKFGGKETTKEQNRIINAFISDSILHIFLKEEEEITKSDVAFCELIFRRCQDQKFAIWFFGTFLDLLTTTLMQKVLLAAERMAENGEY